MIGFARNMARHAALGVAGATVAADWALPSGITLFFDELILFGCVAALKWAYSGQKAQ